jgi:EAL domain-containing protein (putative c-di-GMP-specific phosphodiesterase class I)
VEALLRHYDVAPSLLTFEITETTLMQQPDQALAVLDALVDLGVRVSIDDFGIGHSSLAQLRHLPVHDLKIDRSFVREAASTKNAALLSFILGLGNALGLMVVVEGVESQETLQLLEELGCKAVQGFRIAYPLPAAGFDRWRALHTSPGGAPAGYGMQDSDTAASHQAV